MPRLSTKFEGRYPDSLNDRSPPIGEVKNRFGVTAPIMGKRSLDRFSTSPPTNWFLGMQSSFWVADLLGEIFFSLFSNCKKVWENL